MLPAFPIDVVHLNTRSRSVYAGRRSANAACVFQAGNVPPVPPQAQGHAPVPSILPIARISWTRPALPPTATGSSAQFHPQPRAISIRLVRKWQTDAVDPEGNGTCHTAFSFTIPCRFWLLLIACLTTHLRNATGTFHTHHLHADNCHISLRQVENPEEQAGIWPPSPKIHWELRAMCDGAAEPFLDVVLGFELPSVWRQRAVI